MKFNNISDMFQTQVDRFASKKYILFHDRTYTYSQANKLINQIAAKLLDIGLERGERVGILLENSPEFILSFFAVMKAGGIAVPINTFFKEDEIAYILNDCEAQFIFSSTQFAEEIKNMRELVDTLDNILAFEDFELEGGKKTLNIYNELSGMDDSDFPANQSLDDTAILIYTSGTTGYPKGAILSHKNLLSNVDGCARAFKIARRDRFLLFLPMFHSYAFTTCVMLPTYCGCSIIILSSVLELRKKSFKNILIFKRPTFFLGVPQVYSALTKSKMPQWFIKLIYPVKIHVSGGAPLPEETLNNFIEKFKKPIIEGYGLSEASPVVSVNRLNWQKPYSVGRPLPDVQVKVVDEEEEEVPVGEVGELIAKGPNVMKGYWKKQEATYNTIRNGWLFTGDMAKVDEDGFIYIVDRKKDLIIVKGINVYPRQIEELLYAFENVEAAAVIGIKDKVSGEVPVAYVMPKEGETIDTHKIREYLKKHLANFKLPRHIYVKDELPMTATGKVLKRKLKEQIKDAAKH